MRLRGMGKYYQWRQWVLRDVDLDVQRGDRLAFRGGNGSGKSTLLRIMLGPSRPSAGRTEQRPREIGYVPDRFPPEKRMSARAYLVHLGRIRGLGMRAATRRADDLLALVDGADSAMREPSQGNTRKVAWIQAFLVPPSLLVMDEPWSGLDRSAHGVLGDIMAETANSGGAVVFTEHDESVLRTHATLVHTISGGRVALDDGVPATPSRQTRSPRRARLVLRRPVSEEEHTGTGRWSTRDGVLSVHEQADQVIVHVAEEHTDQLVLSALHDGWSRVSAKRVAVHGDMPEGNVR